MTKYLNNNKSKKQILNQRNTPISWYMLSQIYRKFVLKICQYVLKISGKGNFIVIVDRDKYIKTIEKLLSEESKFQKTTVSLPAKKNASIKFTKSFLTLRNCRKKHKGI